MKVIEVQVCLPECLFLKLAWLESMKVNVSKAPFGLELTIRHTYPEGIHIQKYIKDIINTHVSSDILVELECIRVPFTPKLLATRPPRRDSEDDYVSVEYKTNNSVIYARTKR